MVPVVKRQIVLLRGINVGGNRRVAMADLRTLLARIGYGDVRTHLQSGNVIIESGHTPERLKVAIERGLADELGLEIEVFVRTRDELAAVIARNPLGDVADNPSRYFVSFLSGKPDPSAIRAAKATDAGRERFVVHGRELYAWHPDGVRDSKLAKLLAEKRLGVTATARNWNTVTKLLALADER
jgi:uncharacterized protein (DUF1697 family)